MTICNNNLWMISYMIGAAHSMGTDAMFGIFNDLYTSSGELPPPPGKYVIYYHEGLNILTSKSLIALCRLLV